MRTAALVAAILVVSPLAFAQDASVERRPTKIWNRTGPLDETPKHVTNAFPLSD